MAYISGVLRLLFRMGFCTVATLASRLPPWSWDTLPVAYHGANHTGHFSESAYQQLSRYALVTIEKWYTVCANSEEARSGKDIFTCQVEDKFFDAFRYLKALNPNLFAIMYLNTMFDFTAYRFHERIATRDANGLPGFLRDRHGTVVEMCNDDGVFCNIKTFDLSAGGVRQLWLDSVKNATIMGSVDGIFADHAGANPTTAHDPEAEYAHLCNGKGPKRACWEFDIDFADTFRAGHMELLSRLQDMVVAIERAVRGADFDVVRRLPGLGKSVIEVDACDAAADESQLAGFLCAVEKYTYLACYTHRSDLPTWYPAYDRPLGTPVGPAQELSAGGGMWVRNFSSSRGMTTAVYDSNKKQGHIRWADDDAPPAAPELPLFVL